MSEVQQLYRLQEIDTEIRQKTQRLGEVLKAQKETEELQAARSRATVADGELERWQVRQRALNLELDGLTNKANRSEERLYSGRVTNPKELTDLQNEIASLGRRRAVLEDDLLEAMITIEEAEGEVSAADESLSTLEAEWRQTVAALREEQNELALRLSALTTMRERQVSLIPAAPLAKYEEIRKRRGGLAVAMLAGNLCQGCQLNVSVHIVKSVNQGQFVTCQNCGRILTRKW